MRRGSEDCYDSAFGGRIVTGSGGASGFSFSRPHDLTLVASVVVHPRGVAGKLKQPARNVANRAESMRHLEA